MPKVVFNFRRGGSISQRRGFFATKGHFRSCEMGVLCCEMALMCQSYGDFAAISQLRNEVTVLRNGTRVPRGGFATAKIFAEGGMRLRKWFRSELAISQRTFWGCEIISQQRGDFAAASFGLRNFADQYFFLGFKFLLAPNDLSSISLQFLLHEIIQKD